MSKVFLLICPLLFMVACSGINSTVDQNNEDQAGEPLAQLDERPSDTFMMDLRETMNLSFKIIYAMERKDYDYLESVSAPGVTVSREEDTIHFNDNSVNFLENVNLSNLEYWSSTYLESDTKFQIGFAHFFDDTHSTFYMSFIRKDGHWLFNGFITN
ncbi:hypothetical protein [Paenibacillus sp.]|uniref:hypothetical protein n=1 Tax=Paenibacillus sp. TaxID=58172 RepID=UPI002D60FD23|nr:hypothetical protein [Paenibacillus sp.]HZG84103.1 hypothetical protein [Paenibacillus sp.]